MANPATKTVRVYFRAQETLLTIRAYAGKDGYLFRYGRATYRINPDGEVFIHHHHIKGDRWELFGTTRADGIIEVKA